MKKICICGHNLFTHEKLQVMQPLVLLKGRTYRKYYMAYCNEQKCGCEHFTESEQSRTERSKNKIKTK